MRTLTLLLFSLLTVITSCKKGNGPSGQTNPKPDTLYLLKTDMSYSYDPTGTMVQDSFITKRSYDAQNRLSTYTADDYSGYKDSSSYSYATSENIITDIQYSNATITSKTKVVYYLNSHSLTDSIITTSFSLSTINGIPTPHNSIDITYDHYDANGNDILDSSFDITAAKTLEGYTQRVYAGNSLVSSTNFESNGSESSTSEFQDGNVISVNIFNGGTISATETFTYLPILSGGFYGGGIPKNLTATFTQNVPQGAGSRYQSYSYTFDNANRVSTLTTTNADGKILEKDIYTYY